MVFVVINIIAIPLIHHYNSNPADQFNYNSFNPKHLAVLTTILCTILLGFTDDILELQWRYKLIIPFVIILPIPVSYTHLTLPTIYSV